MNEAKILEQIAHHLKYGMPLVVVLGHPRSSYPDSQVLRALESHERLSSWQVALLCGYGCDAKGLRKARRIMREMAQLNAPTNLREDSQHHALEYCSARRPGTWAQLRKASLVSPS